MTYVALTKKKKNSPAATLTVAASSTDDTLTVDHLEYFHDDDGNLIAEGIVLGFDNSNDILPERVTITAASTTSGAGTLTGVTRGVNPDGTIGAANAWASGTKLAVMGLTDGDWNQIGDNFIAHESGKASKTTAAMSVYVDAAATGAADGTSWTDAFTTIQAAVDSLPVILEHDVTIYIRKVSVAYDENVVITQMVGRGSLTLRGEYYWYDQCAAAATPSTTKFNITATDGAHVEAGDAVLVRDGHADYVVSTVKSTVDKGSNVWEIELNDALPTGNIGTGDYYSIAKTAVAPTNGHAVNILGSDKVYIYGLRLTGGGNGYGIDTLSVASLTIDCCFLYGVANSAPNGYAFRTDGAYARHYIYRSYVSAAISRAIAIGCGSVYIGNGTDQSGCVIETGTGGSGVVAVAPSQSFVYNSIIHTPGGTGFNFSRNSGAYIGSCTISPSGKTVATTGIVASYNASVQVVSTTNNATTPKTPASATDAAYIT